MSVFSEILHFVEGRFKFGSFMPLVDALLKFLEVVADQNDPKMIAEIENVVKEVIILLEKATDSKPSSSKK